MSGLAALALVGVSLPASISAVESQRGVSWGIRAEQLAPQISPGVAAKRFAPTITLPGFAVRGEFSVRYTLDANLQRRAQQLLAKHNPDYGVLVAIDPDDGRVLLMADSARGDASSDGVAGNMAINNRYPAASISKMVTAVAAINENKLSGETIVPFNGKATSLYKKSVLRHRDNKWTRHYSFATSFARSVNSVFGRVGAIDVGGETMLGYANRLGFNRRFASDFAFGSGVIAVDPDNDWQVAEMASGYTRRNTLSPLHGAVLAATAANNGHLVAPMIVEELTGPNGVPLYWRTRFAKTKVMHYETARQLRVMMRKTVTSGSARSSFVGFRRGKLKDAVIGGKTGSLSGLSPRGKYDWFIGFGEHDGKKIAFAALCINKKLWRVKSAQLARELLEFYFDAPPNDDSESDSDPDSTTAQADDETVSRRGA